MQIMLLINYKNQVMSESLLKKEFKQEDVQRARNLINKKFGDKTKIQSGYQKAFVKHNEGDIWEE